MSNAYLSACGFDVSVSRDYLLCSSQCSLSFLLSSRNRTDNAHIVLPCEIEKADIMDTEVTADTGANPQAANTDQAHTALKNFQYRPVTNRKERGIAARPLSTDLKGFQYHPVGKLLAKGHDTEPSLKKDGFKHMPSKSYKRKLSRRSSIDPPEMDTRDKEDDRDAKLVGAHIVSFRDHEFDSIAACAIATTRDDIPEVIKVSRPDPDTRFRRSATSDSKLSSALRKSGNRALKAKRRISESSKPSSIEQQKLSSVKVARERRNLNESRDMNSIEQKRMLLEKERMLLEKLRREKKLERRSSESVKPSSDS